MIATPALKSPFLRHCMMILCIIPLLMSAMHAMATEEPKYTLLEKENAFELRAYESKLIAEVLVDGDMPDATRKGFKLIADFIFGNNNTPTGQSEKVSMTAPVAIKPASEKIAMTAPVGLQKAQNNWRVYFVMPSEYTLETLPKPNNPQVVIKAIPAKKCAVITFSGLVGEEKMVAKEAELNAWIKSKNLTASSNPELARYNPPWTLPFLRRNEIMVEVE